MSYKLTGKLFPESFISVVAALKTCLAFVSSVQTLRMKFLQKITVFIFSHRKRTTEKHRLFSATLPRFSCSSLLFHFLSLPGLWIKKYRYTHSHFCMCIYILCTHRHPHTSKLSKIPKICTPVGLACCCEAQSKFSAHFLMQQRPWDFFFWIYTLDNSGLFLHVAGGLCVSQISVKHTSLCDYLECDAATFMISCSLISKNRLCAWIWEFVCLWWNESAMCWFRSELDPLSDEHLVYII